jgi:hypothetical protein
MSCILTLGCNPGDRQESNVIEARSRASLPHISDGHTDYPYTRYSESTGQTASRGRAFFLYPIKARKSQILALEYAPGMEVGDLFGEDLIGTSGEVVNENGQIVIPFLPISIPIGLVVGQSWRMTYTNHVFICKSQVSSDLTKSEKIKVSCTDDKDTLTFVYDRQLGVTEFQDFCDFSICTYKLMDSSGLLSPAMTLSMNLPKI